MWRRSPGAVVRYRMRVSCLPQTPAADRIATMRFASSLARPGSARRGPSPARWRTLGLPLETEVQVVKELWWMRETVSTSTWTPLRGALNRSSR